MKKSPKIFADDTRYHRKRNDERNELLHSWADCHLGDETARG